MTKLPHLDHLAVLQLEEAADLLAVGHVGGEALHADDSAEVLRVSFLSLRFPFRVCRIYLGFLDALLPGHPAMSSHLHVDAVVRHLQRRGVHLQARGW